jgi:hypothetical protein
LHSSFSFAVSVAAWWLSGVRQFTTRRVPRVRRSTIDEHFTYAKRNSRPHLRVQRGRVVTGLSRCCDYEEAMLVVTASVQKGGRALDDVLIERAPEAFDLPLVCGR